MKKKINIFIICFLIIISILSTKCYATFVDVTEEKLKTVLQEIDENQKDYEFSMNDDGIDVKTEGKSYKMNYDLTETPKFSLTIPIKKGMSYEDFEEQTSRMTSVMFGYIAVTNIQGVEYKDSSAYIAFSLLAKSLEAFKPEGENVYFIVKDTDLPEGVTIEKDDNPKTIYTSEFGDRVMEYVNNIYKEKTTLSDSSELDTYVWTVEKKDVTETSCNLVSTLTVKLDADFSRLDGYSDNLIDEPDITKENADYVIDLKVGEKYTFQIDEEIMGYELYGNDGYIEYSEDYSAITGIKEGVTYGYIHLEESDKTIYVTVTEKDDNSNEENKESDKEIGKEQEKEEIKKDDTIINSPELPQTGVKNRVLISAFIAIICTVLIAIKLIKNKDIK